MIQMASAEAQEAAQQMQKLWKKTKHCTKTVHAKLWNFQAKKGETPGMQIPRLNAVICSLTWPLALHHQLRTRRLPHFHSACWWFKCPLPKLPELAHSWSGSRGCKLLSDWCRMACNAMLAHAPIEKTDISILTVVTSMASSQQTEANTTAIHPTRGRRRKHKGPPAIFPHLPLTAIQHILDTSSHYLFELEKFMGIGLASSPLWRGRRFWERRLRWGSSW